MTELGSMVILRMVLIILASAWRFIPTSGSWIVLLALSKEMAANTASMDREEHLWKEPR